MILHFGVELNYALDRFSALPGKNLTAAVHLYAALALI